MAPPDPSIPPAWLGPHGRYLLARRVLLEPYVERRIPLFAVRYGTKIPVAKWRDAALSNKIDEVALTQDTNVAAVCGELSNLDVFDIEAPHVERFLAYCDRSKARNLLDRVPRIRTWSGGAHWYFQHTHGQQTRDLWIDGVKVGQVKAGATTVNGKLLVSYVLVPPSVIVRPGEDGAERRGSYVVEVSLREGAWLDVPPALAAIIGKAGGESDRRKKEEEEEEEEAGGNEDEQPEAGQGGEEEGRAGTSSNLYGWPVTDDPDEAIARMRRCIADTAFLPVTRATDRSAVLYGAVREAIFVGASQDAIEGVVARMPSNQKIAERAALGDTSYLARTIRSAKRQAQNLRTTLVTVHESRGYEHTAGSLRRLWIRAFDAAGNHYHADVTALDADGNVTGDWEQLCASLWRFVKTRALARNLRDHPARTLVPAGTPLRVEAAATDNAAWLSYRVLRFVPV